MFISTLSKVTDETDWDDDEIIANRIKWITALESGKYNQGSGSLRSSIPGLNYIIARGDTGKPTEEDFPKLPTNYCCLGVWCEVSTWDFNDDEEQLNSNGMESLGLARETMEELIVMNDSKSDSFTKIAKYLRGIWDLIE